MAKILNMPNSQSRCTAGCRSSQNRLFDSPASIDDIADLIRAIEQKGDWRIRDWGERCEWYLRLSAYTMDTLCNAATVMLLKGDRICVDTLVGIAQQLVEQKVAHQHEETSLIALLQQISNQLAAIEFQLADRRPAK
jgi:hypothetical protein